MAVWVNFKAKFGACIIFMYNPFIHFFFIRAIAFFPPITPLHTTIRSPSSRWPPRCFARLDARVMYYYVAWPAIGDIQRRRIARWLQYVLFTVWTSAVFFYIKIGFFLVTRHIYTHVPPCVRAFTLYIARHSACFDTHLDHWQRHLDRKCLRTHTRQLTWRQPVKFPPLPPFCLPSSLPSPSLFVFFFFWCFCYVRFGCVVCVCVWNSATNTPVSIETGENRKCKN